MTTTLAPRDALEDIWGPIAMPDWDADRLYALFQANQAAGGLDAAERDEFARRLMDLVAARLYRMRSDLRRAGIDLEDAAAGVMLGVHRSAPQMRLRHPCTKVMLANLQLFCRSRVLDMIRRQRDPSINETDAGGPDNRNALAAIATTRGDGPDMDRKRLADAILQRQPEHIADVGRNPARLAKVHAQIARALVYHGEIPTYQHFRRSHPDLSQNQHGIIVARILRCVRSIACEHAIAEIAA